MNPDYPLLEKGYEINLNRIAEGFWYTSLSCSAGTRSKAKSKLLNQAKMEGILDLVNGEELTFLNIPIVRCPSADVYEFEGTHRTLVQIEDIIAGRERHMALTAILDNPDVSHCYIKKRGNFYRPNHCGYTEFKKEAGIYTKYDAVSHARGVNEIEIVPIIIEEHNAMIIEAISNLEKQFIQ